MTILCSNSSPKYPNQTFSVPNLRALTFASNFTIRHKFETADFKCDNSFSKLPPKTPKEGIFGPWFKEFYFVQKFIFMKIRGKWFQIWQYFLKYPARKYPNKVFLVPNLGIFVLARNFCPCNQANSRTLVSNMAILFEMSSPKISK